MFKFFSFFLFLGLILGLSSASSQKLGTQNPADSITTSLGASKPQTRTLQSQNLSSQKGKVKRIIIKGNHFLSTPQIKSHLSIKKGEGWNKLKIQKDVRHLFSLGFFDDIQVSGTPDRKNRWTLTYKLKERIFISNIEFQGNKKLNDKSLKEEAFIDEFSFLDPNKLEKTLIDIRKKYKEKAHYSVEVSYQLEKDEENKKAKKLVIHIKENNKLYIKKIQFIGNRNISNKKIKVFLKSREKNLLSFFTSQGVFQPENLDHDRQVIEYFYRNEGYLNVKVHPARVSLSADKKNLFLDFEISEGNRFKMGSYVLKEKELIEKKKFLKLYEKEYFSLGDLQQDIQSISQVFKNKGHALVKVEPLFYPDQIEEDKIHIGFKIDKGEIYNVSYIDIKGNQKVRDKVVFRRFQIKEGDIYNQDQIDLTRQLLEQLSVFEKVNISTGTAHPSKKEIQLQVLVKERENTGEASLVGGYNNVTKLFIQGGLKKENFLGLEQNIAVKVSMGYYDETMVLYYQNPYFLDTRWNFGFELFNLGQENYIGSQFSTLNLLGNNDYKTYFSLESGLSFSVGRKLGPFSNLLLKYRFSNQKISDTAVYFLRSLPILRNIFQTLDISSSSSDSSQLKNTENIEEEQNLPNYSKESLSQFRFNDIYDFESATGLKSSLSLIWEQDKRNDRFYAMRGFLARISAEYVGLGGHLEYSKLSGDFRHYYNPVWKLVVKNRMDLGWVFPNQKGQEVPFTELFLLGGPYNLRGFLTNSQGPRKYSEQAYKRTIYHNNQQTDDLHKFNNPKKFAERPYGGTQKLFYSLELEIPLVERANLRLASFLDIGEVNNSISLNLHDQLRANVGVGVRWLSPFGPLSLDWAVPYKARKEFEEDSWQVQFSVGSVL